MSARAEQKQQTRKALLEAAHKLMESGRGFASLSLREVARTTGIVPTGFYRHFDDMDQLGLALVTEVGQTFRQTIRLVRHNEMVMGGLIEASVRIFLEDVAANRPQFLFLAREQYGGSLKVRQALGALREGIVADLATDLGKMTKWQHLNGTSLAIIADLVVKSVFAMLPELIDPPATPLAAHQTPQAKITEQLRFIFMGARHWRGLNR
ncbi:TetR family transcriptional regulator [Pseudomonas syringae]|nr:TetR family transcriptional regulator [Pseudomonas syringae]MBD8575530.1 TetR family transcriptional regulator [Pseudomonas syringae]MBD8788691.1 TetR family transcriptional regulator [Pseudomonas syringae]MBD8801749.1 TetR family transcriptional regulator [Pseudomonas syringae]MBD8811306.1 TetR family transcriptional regulator [Pseudomonas syringae]